MFSAQQSLPCRSFGQFLAILVICQSEGGEVAIVLCTVSRSTPSRIVVDMCNRIYGIALCAVGVCSALRCVRLWILLRFLMIYCSIQGQTGVSIYSNGCQLLACSKLQVLARSELMPAPALSELIPVLARSELMPAPARRDGRQGMRIYATDTQQDFPSDSR